MQVGYNTDLQIFQLCVRLYVVTSLRRCQRYVNNVKYRMSAATQSVNKDMSNVGVTYMACHVALVLLKC